MSSDPPPPGCGLTVCNFTETQLRQYHKQGTDFSFTAVHVYVAIHYGARVVRYRKQTGMPETTKCPYWAA